MRQKKDDLEKEKADRTKEMLQSEANKTIAEKLKECNGSKKEKEKEIEALKKQVSEYDVKMANMISRTMEEERKSIQLCEYLEMVKKVNKELELKLVEKDKGETQLQNSKLTPEMHDVEPSDTNDINKIEWIKEDDDQKKMHNSGYPKTCNEFKDEPGVSDKQKDRGSDTKAKTANRSSSPDEKTDRHKNTDTVFNDRGKKSIYIEKPGKTEDVRYNNRTKKTSYNERPRSREDLIEKQRLNKLQNATSPDWDNTFAELRNRAGKSDKQKEVTEQNCAGTYKIVTYTFL